MELKRKSNLRFFGRFRWTSFPITVPIFGVSKISILVKFTEWIEFAQTEMKKSKITKWCIVIVSQGGGFPSSLSLSNSLLRVRTEMTIDFTFIYVF